MPYAIEINNLTKSYGTARGITNVSFNVAEGEVFGFIGPNGAGKSTTIRTLLSLIYPNSGNMKIFGLDCIKDAPEIAKRTGYLPSEVFYYDGMKVSELLKYSASFYKKDCTAKMKSLCDIMDLDTTKKVEDLSFGNKKKVGIVQGLLHNPDLIILDEPTSGLDPLMQATFFDLLREENKKGAAILLSSHILSEVQRLCNRVAIIKDGKIVTVSTVDELKKDSYKRFHIETEEKVADDYFKINGVSDMKNEGNTHSFIYKGDINAIIIKLSAVKVHNFTAEEPDLEEIFMHYYEKPDH